METSVCNSQLPRYRLSGVSQHHVTSRQSNSVDTRPDMTSRDVYRTGSRGIDCRAVPVPHTSARVLNGRIFDQERVRRLSGPKTDDRNVAGSRCQRPVTVSSSRVRPAMAATSCSLPRELGQVEDAVGSTATSRLFGCAARHLQIHESSNSAPADCTAHLRRARGGVPGARLPCGTGVRATTVSVRTPNHLTTSYRPTATSSNDKDSRRSSSRSMSRSQLGVCLWIGVAQTVDVRPVSATALTATVDCNNREFNYQTVFIDEIEVV